MDSSKVKWLHRRYKTMVKYFNIAVILFTLFSIQLFAKLPEKPKDFLFTQDYAKIIDNKTFREIAQIQKVEFEKNKTPIIVVTINQMKDYVSPPYSIESFTADLFNSWGIGSQEVNTGILFVISVQDRKARIELGEDWGHVWNSYSQEIMDNKIIPNFKLNDYNTGIIEGVKALALMSAAGAYGVPPVKSRLEKFKDFKTRLISENPLAKRYGANHLNIAFWVGLALLIGSFFVDPPLKKKLMIAGLLLIAIVLFLYVVAFIITLFSRGRGFGSAGGFGGGSSGGGGASGGW